MHYPFTPDLRTRLVANLSAAPAVTLTIADHHRAAVGMVLLPDEAGETCFVLTLRPSTLRRHAGQFALPGGRLEPGETPEAAALREISEEIGLVLAPDAVLGRLDDFASRSGHLITPIVFWTSAVDVVTNPEEVEAAYRLPIADLELPGNPRLEPLLHFALADSTVYAPTAAILYQFREQAVHGRRTQVAHFEQPRFAWR
ncbi:MAG TPA: CoA pyrophosphatase [Chloroflexota bacterium]|jgi:8-oxo-dGTP pyrophosphatase MutT (NUDIX family)